MYFYYNYACYCNYAHYCIFCCIGWLESVGSRVVYQLDYKKPILYVIPIQSILGKLPDDSMAQTGLCIEVTWNISPCASARCDPLRFITYPASIPKPTS